MRPSLYETAGGAAGLLALATAHHARCLAYPELSHPFSQPDANPEHLPRLVAYWAEVLGGPAVFSSEYGDQSGFLHFHAGNGEDLSDLGRRFVDCFVGALDDAGLPSDEEFRAAMRSYVVWAVADVLDHDDPATIAAGLPMPHWSWEGRVIG